MNRSDLPLVIEATQAARHALIWLHGLGADAHDFELIVPELRFSQKAHTRFVFPNAPVVPVTINGGMRMRAWYDIVHPNLGAAPDLAGMTRSAQRLQAWLDEQIAAGIPARHIVLAGFSQGGVICLHTLATLREPLAGVMALSAYWADGGEPVSAAATQTPVLMMHGVADPVVPLALGQASRQALVAQGCQVQWRSYPMPHSVCPQQIADIGDWLERRLTG